MFRLKNCSSEGGKWAKLDTQYGRFDKNSHRQRPRLIFAVFPSRPLRYMTECENRELKSKAEKILIW